MKFFHRYHSTIHGNYRRAYLRGGLLTAAMLVCHILLRYLMGKPAESPESYLCDGIMLVAVFLLAMLYRNSLADKQATLKELMLFGMGTAVVASVVYGLFLWIFGCLAAGQTIIFTRTLAGKEIAADDSQLHYWAALWAMVTAARMAILGGFGAFLAALLFRNEKAPVHQKDNEQQQ